jgi:hypothetical protein
MWLITIKNKNIAVNQLAIKTGEFSINCLHLRIEGAFNNGCYGRGEKSASPKRRQKKRPNKLGRNSKFLELLIPRKG